MLTRRFSISPLEILSRGARRLASNSRKYAQKTALALTLLASGVACSPTTQENDNGFTPDEPTPTQNDNSDPATTQIESAIINEDISDNHLAIIEDSSNTVLNIWGERGNNGSLSHVSTIALDPPGPEKINIGTYPDGKLAFAQNQQGFGFQVIEYITENRAHILYFSPDGESTRVVLNHSSLNSRSSSSHSDSCNLLEDLMSEACDITDAVRNFTNPEGVASSVLGYLTGDVGSLSTILSGWNFLRDPTGYFCDRFFDCSDVNISVEGIIEGPNFETPRLILPTGAEGFPIDEPESSPPDNPPPQGNLVQNGEFANSANGWRIIDHHDANWQNTPGWDGNPGWFKINDFPGRSPYTSQTISGLIQGENYTVSGHFRKLHENHQGEAFRILLDESEYFSTSGSIENGWTPFSFSYTANNNEVSLVFRSQVTADDDYGIDNITFTGN